MQRFALSVEVLRGRLNTCMNKRVKTHFFKCKLIFLSLDAYSTPPRLTSLPSKTSSVLCSVWSDSWWIWMEWPPPLSTLVTSFDFTAPLPSLPLTFATRKLLSGKGTLHICLAGESNPTPKIRVCLQASFRYFLACKEVFFPFLLSLPYFNLFDSSNHSLSKWGQRLLSTCHMPSPVRGPKDTRMNEVHACVPVFPLLQLTLAALTPGLGLARPCFPSTELSWISLFCYFPPRDFKLSFLETYHSN